MAPLPPLHTLIMFGVLAMCTFHTFVLLVHHSQINLNFDKYKRQI